MVEYDDASIDVRVFGSGLIMFNGKFGVAVEGKHQRRIEPEEVNQLLEVFRVANFFSLCDDYSVNATDTSSRDTSIQIGTLRKTITDNWLETPSALKAAQQGILKYSHSDQWVKGNAEYSYGSAPRNA